MYVYMYMNAVRIYMCTNVMCITVQSCCRLAADHRLSEAMSNLEKATVAHSEKVSELQESLTTQKQLASKYNDRVRPCN